MNWQEVFSEGLAYHDFLEEYGTADHRDRWKNVNDQVTLTGDQKTLLASFTRKMNVLCLAGAWCGDCVNQCPILQRFAEASPAIALRFFDRDHHTQLRDELGICAGHRVPMVVFCSEEFHECGRYGDRTLSKYRELARTLQGAACPTGLGKQDESLLQAVTCEWLNEFERIQWMLRLSGRLREKHND